MEEKNKHFEDVKKVYDEFYKFLILKHNMYPVKDTGIGYWGVSVADEIFEIFKKIDLSKYNHVLDLGSGDGKVSIIASLFTRSTGIEYDSWLHDVSNDVKNKLFHVPHMNRVEFFNEDYMEHDLNNYDLIFFNPDKKCDKLIKKLNNEFKGKLIFYGPHYKPEDLVPEDEFHINGTYVNIFNFEKKD